MQVRPHRGRNEALARWQGRVSTVSHTRPNHSALELFFCDFSAATPRFVARLARSDSPQSRRPCPRADPPSPRPSRSASEVARSRLRGLPHAPQSQPCFFTTTSLLGSSYSPAVTLFFFLLFLVLDRHDYRVTACVHRRNTGRTRPRFVARLARSDSPQSRGPCPCADPPSPRPSRSVSKVARSGLVPCEIATKGVVFFFPYRTAIRSGLAYIILGATRTYLQY